MVLFVNAARAGETMETAITVARMPDRNQAAFCFHWHYNRYDRLCKGNCEEVYEIVQDRNFMKY